MQLDQATAIAERVKAQLARHCKVEGRKPASERGLTMVLDDLRAAIRSLEEAAQREGYYSDGSKQQNQARKDRAAAWERIESLLVPSAGHEARRQ
jgi:hypothetical protein